MTSPVYTEMRSEAACGCTFVLFLIGLFVAMVHGFAGGSGNVPKQIMQVGLIAIYTEAGLALFCLSALMLGNPGVVKRSERNTFPLPAEVCERLGKGLALEGLENVRGDGGRSFCVRCMVWRSSDAHHCSTCQRCVERFDHHCGVFGRCIAGRGCLAGNMRFFKSLIGLGMMGGLTALGFVAISLKP